MTSLMRTILFVILCSVGAVSSLWRVHDMGDQLSTVDRFSEANALRELHNFLDHGLRHDHGLGNVYYPGMYPSDGSEAEPADMRHGVTPDGVYTHYPPGPEYLLYAAAKLFGPEPVSRLRLLPIAIGWAATLFLGFAIRRRFGELAGFLVMAACAVTPSVTDGFIGLHYQGYALAMLMVELGVAIGSGRWLTPFALLGFVQGWLSFDYVFLVTATPLALELVLPRIDPAYAARWRLGLTRAVLAGGGFAAAHGLHLLEVWSFWGSLDATVRDFAGAASYRADAGQVGYPAQALGNLKTYFYGLHPLHIGPTPPDLEEWSMFRFLGLSLGPWWLLVTVALMLRRDAHSLRMDWHFVCAVGMATSSLWLLAMVNHGGMHRHFLFRHLFFVFLVMALFGATRVALDMRSILPRSLARDATQETGHEIRDLL